MDYDTFCSGLRVLNKTGHLVPFVPGGLLPMTSDTKRSVFEQIRDDIHLVREHGRPRQVFPVSPATYANLLDIAEREGFPFDKPAVKTPRARGAVASWVLGRFVPVAPRQTVIFKGRSVGISTENIMRELRTPCP